MDRENRIYQQQGFGAQRGIKGQIGLLIVDFVNAFVDPLVFGGGNMLMRQPRLSRFSLTREKPDGPSPIAE